MSYLDGPEVFLPALQPRPWGRFLDAVPNITEQFIDTNENTGETVNRTARGAKFMAEAALSPIIVDYTCGVDDDKTEGNLGLTLTEAAGFLSFNLLTCSTLSGDLDPLKNYVNRNFNATVSEALAYAATNPISADHLNLADDSDVVSASTSLVDVIGAIEAGLAERISNEQGYIFISPRYLAAARSAAVLTFFNGTLYTPSGHIVISDAGHRPYNVVYGTAGLGYSITNAEDLDSLDHSGSVSRGSEGNRNLVTWLKENYGLVVFNPNWSVRSTLTGGVSA